MALKKFPLKTLVSAALLALVVYFVGSRELLDTILSCDPVFMGLACLSFAVGQLLNTVRWRWLLASVDAPSPRLIDLFLLNLTGMYYNFFAPSTIGGDVLQAEAAKRYVGGRRHSYISILMNRVIALFAIIALGAAFAVAAVVSVDGLPRVYLHITLALLGLAALAVPGVQILYRLKVPGFVTRRWPELVERVRSVITEYSGQWQTILRVFFLAMVSNLFGFVLVIWAIAEGMGIHVSGLVHGFLVPTMVLVTLAPITVNGLGLREATFIFLYGGIGVGATSAVAVSVVFSGVLLIFGLLGGVATLSERYRVSLK